MAYAFTLAVIIVGLRVEASAANAEIKTVILISVDGLGRDLLSKVQTPHIDSLASKGQRIKRARTVIPAKTVAAHVSMLTGVKPERHGNVINELEDGLVKVSVPSVFDLLRKSGRKSVAVFGKEKLSFVFGTGAIDVMHLRKLPILGTFAARLPSYVEAKAIETLRTDPPALLFLHFALPDTVGHWFHWDSVLQRRAVARVDSAIGRITMAAKEFLKEGSYAIIVTADHGGHRGSHGGFTASGALEDENSDLFIPWIISGVKMKTVPDELQIYDTAPTIADLLNLKVPSSWNWQGRSLFATPQNATIPISK